MYYNFVFLFHVSWMAYYFVLEFVTHFSWIQMKYCIITILYRTGVTHLIVCQTRDFLVSGQTNVFFQKIARNFCRLHTRFYLISQILLGCQIGQIKFDVEFVSNYSKNNWTDNKLPVSMTMKQNLQKS